MRVVAPLSILALVVVVVAGRAHSAVHCSIHGSTHVVMSDGTSKYQQHSGGLFRAFATAYNGMRLDVQCEFTDRTAAPGASPQQVTSSSAVLSEPEMTSCRVLVYDAGRGCGVDIRHDGTQNSGYGSIAGRAMPLSSMNQVPIDPHLGVKVIPLTGNALSVESNWNGTFIQVVLGEKYMQVHSAVVPTCAGLCGNCQGVQAPPMDISSMAAFVASQQVAPAQAIQPQALCGTSGLGLGASLSAGIPQLFPQQQQGAMLGAYPYPAYSPPTLADLYYTAQFQTEAQLLMAFEQCSAGDMVRLQYDPIFNSFVEDCMYDKSLGVGFDAAAKSSMDAFVTFTESILRSARVAQVLAVSPYLVQVCAACIPVQWPDTIQTTQILTSIASSSGSRAYERLASGGVTFPMRYASINNYAIDPFVQALLSSAMSGASASSSWNANIVMPSWSSASMLTLPSQLVSAPLVANGQSSLSWNTMPLLGGGVCSTIDPSRLSQIEMLIQQYIENGQATQLASQIQQGQYYSVCQAMACGMGQQSSTMASFATYLPLSSVASLCPISTVPSSMFYNSYGQYNGSNLPYNVYGQSTASLYDNYLQGATYAQQALGMYGSYGAIGGSMYGQAMGGSMYGQAMGGSMYGQAMGTAYNGQAMGTAYNGQGVSGNSYYGNGMWNAANGNVANGYVSGQAFGANGMWNGNGANGMWNGNVANGMWNGNVATGMWSGNVANGYFNGQSFGANSMWNGNGYLSGQAFGGNGMWNGNVANGQAYGGNMVNGNLAASQYLGGQALNGNGFVAGSGVLNGAMTGSSGVLNGAGMYANANMLGTGSVNTLNGQFGGNFNGQFAGGAAFNMNGQMMSVNNGASQQLLTEAEMLAGAPTMSQVQGAMGTAGSTAERILAQQDTGNTVQALGQAPLGATLMA